MIPACLMKNRRDLTGDCRVSLNVAYPCEILPYRLRANGLMVQSLATNVMLFFNQYVNPIGIQHASWRYYFLFEGTLLIQVSPLILYKFARTKMYHSSLPYISSSLRRKVLPSKKFHALSMARMLLKRSKCVLWCLRRRIWWSKLRM